MDLHAGFKKALFASCLALQGAGCATSATPGSSDHANHGANSAGPLASETWRLSVSPGDDGTYRIHVADRSGRERQVLDGPDRTPPYAASELVRLDDFTGDGKPDILARGHSAGASALISETIYVYDAAAGRFLDAEVFESEGEVTKTAPGCIAVQHRMPDNVTYAKDAYCWKGKWVYEGSAR
ncbi:MAG TPA: hypothetical protein VFE72_00700 [Lysobacter sp.]|nr:hypothetical protein [Lysobacter sp.]